MVSVRPLLVRVVLGLSLVGALGCNESKPAARPGTLQYTENARAAYQRALEAFQSHDWEEAAALFNDVKRNYGQSPYARLAELRLADIAFEQDKLPEAISSYKTFVQSHRHDPAIAYARYRVCRALFLQISDTLLLPPQEERDQSTVVDAYHELQRFAEEFPDTKWSAQVQYMLESVTGRLVRHELYAARFYLQRDNFNAAVSRIQYALRNYENSGLEAEALVLLGETYLKMKKPAEARETLQRVLSTYPDSPFVTAAQSFLNEIPASKR